MSSHLTDQDIDDKILEKIYTQNYSEQEGIDGVQIVDLEYHIGEDGDFAEILRVDPNGEVAGVAGFHIGQINRTYILPNTIKAWHLHYKQDELWYLPPNFRLLIGLWDVRKKSSSSGKVIRTVLGGGKSQLLLIPHGVAHGSFNVSEEGINLYYFVSQSFDKDDPDEKRIPYDALGEKFWSPQRD